ncbi:hypothetical protein WJX72_005354 [[Myrmecia] bisecta]|uniref:Uncharacterized protein n=1 Tax=[Myrmecia] bisecta TaxID=41462 RepID=A0AAW1Q350_9CHLO
MGGSSRRLLVRQNATRHNATALETTTYVTPSGLEVQARVRHRAADRAQQAQQAQHPAQHRDTDLPYPDQHFAVFVVFAWNYDVFLIALRCYVTSGWGQRIIIIDNSKTQQLANDRVVAKLAGEVIGVGSQLTFSQVQNYIMSIARERSYDYYFWGHSDTIGLASAPDKLFADEVMRSMEVLQATEPRWGIAFFSSDWLEADWFSAMRTDMVRELQYDTFVQVYFSDCDFYPRVRAAGWKTLVAPEFPGHVYDMNTALSLPLHDWNATRDALEKAKSEINNNNRNDWKEKTFTYGERVGMEIFQKASNSYFYEKWGTMNCGEIDGMHPFGLTPHGPLKIQPWEARKKREEEERAKREKEEADKRAAEEEAKAEEAKKAAEEAQRKAEEEAREAAGPVAAEDQQDELQGARQEFAEIRKAATQDGEGEGAGKVIVLP